MNAKMTNTEIVKSWKVNSSWTLFLDRDGVINSRKIGAYITIVDEFEFIPDVINAFSLLHDFFMHTIVVTNQQGIGKGIMTSESLDQIHDFMIRSIQKEKGKIDKVYYCPNLASENNVNRKPNIGMAMQACKDFANINLKYSIMVGDSVSDMQFARSAGMKAVYIGSPEEDNIESSQYDIYYQSFYDFAKEIYNIYITNF